jgi:hypothetical protein
MLYEEKEIPEMFYMKHRHDSKVDYNDYENNLLDKMLSPNIYNSDIMFVFLKNLQPLVAKLFDQFNIMKNWQNYMVDKYYHQHGK